MELFWEKVLGLRISKKLVEVCNNWGFNIHYYNSVSQEIRSVYRSDTTLCNFIEQSPQAKQASNSWIKKLTTLTRDSGQPFIDKCPVGLPALIVPIFNTDTCLGYVMAVGE